MADKKGYGIVIPNEWETKKVEKLSLEDFHEELMRLDKEAFYRMANEVELDLPLLENAGYEYQGLSSIALIELDNFARSSDTLRNYEKYIIEVNPASYEMRADFDYVLALYDREHHLFDKYYPEDMARIYSQEVADVATTENSLTIKLIRLFIDEFKDAQTEWRYKVLEKYGVRFQSCFAFEYFVSKRGLSEWSYKSGNEYADRDLEQAERLKELMNLYRLLKDGSDLIVQSSLFKSRKAMISANAAKILGDLIIMGVPHIRAFDFRMGEVEGTFDNTGQFIPVMNADNETYRSICAELDHVIENSVAEKDLKLFFYLADNAIWWPDGVGITQRYIFLYKLSQFFGYVKASDYEDLTNGDVRKEITDRIKRMMKSMEKEDKDKSLLMKYLR